MLDPDAATIIILLLVAAPFVGSFLGVAITRIPDGASVLWPPSHCDACGYRIAVRDLVPIVSFMALGGRCRHCREPIARLLPLIEVSAFAVAVWAVAAVPAMIAVWSMLLGWALLALAVIDAQHMVLPDAITLPLIPLGLCAALFISGENVIWHVLGAAVGLGLFWAMRVVFARARRRQGLGLGDVKLFSAAGAWVGLAGLPSVMLLAAFSGLVYAALRRRDAAISEPLPFGPFLCAGLWLTWLYGPLQFAI